MFVEDKRSNPWTSVKRQGIKLNTKGEKARAIKHLSLPFIEIVSVTDAIKQFHWNIDMCVVGTYFLQAH